jgi:hypothetical protein
MPKFWKITNSKKPESRFELSPNGREPADPFACIHGGLLRARVRELKGGFSDSDVIVYACSRCGFPFLAAPLEKFKDDKEALQFFRQIASEVRIPKLKK